MITKKSMTTAVALGLGLCCAGPALASSHREAPAISKDPVADNADTYAWVNKGTHDKMQVVLTYNPLEEPAGGPNFNEFSSEVLYELHITRGGSSLSDVLTYQFYFTKSPIAQVSVADLTKGPGGGKEFFSQLSEQTTTLRVVKITAGGSPQIIADNVPVAPPNIGPQTQTVLKSFNLASSATYNDAFAATFIANTSEGGRVWAGPRDDGFYVDLGGIFDLANLRAQGTAQDGVSGFNVHAIAIEIPTTSLTANGQAPGSTPGNNTLIGVWASASRRQINIRLNNGTNFAFGPWVQVSRLGLPLINEAVIGLQDKDRWNAYHPSQESYFYPYFLNPVIVRDAAAVGIYTTLKVDPTPFESGRTDILDIINLTNIPTNGAHSVTQTGDVLRLDIATDSGFPNGRSIPGGTLATQEQNDVTDTLLTVLLSKGAVAIKDNVNYNDKPFLTDVPWLALPWQGYAQGHGIPTP